MIYFMSNVYYKRVLDDVLDKRLNMIGAVLIVGPKWCGKTTTARKHALSILELQDPDNQQSYLELAEIKPSKLLEGKKPRLIDEWQMAPVLWDAVRTSVDKTEGDGLYILTGSTVVDETQIMHSGIGRINRLTMLPMSLYESKESNGKISILELFKNPKLDIDGIKSELPIEDLIFAACRGGWPESIIKKDTESKLFVAKNYVTSISNYGMSHVDKIKRDPKKVEAILKAYSRNISTIASYETIIKDVHGSFPDLANSTFYSYVEALSKLFVISDVPAWSPNIRSKGAIRATPKKEFIDPSIAVASLGLNPESLIFDLKTFGFIFETLCFRDLKVYTSPVNGQVSYYRDKTGLEADCILHLENGDYALIEFKLGKKEIEKAAKNLIKLNKLIDEKIIENDLKIKKPKFLAVITGGEFAYTRNDGVKIIPIGVLKQ